MSFIIRNKKEKKVLTKENATRETQTFNDYHSEEEYRKKEKKKTQKRNKIV